MRCFDIAHSDLACHLPSATHVTHSLPFPAQKVCRDVPACFDKCWDTRNKCLAAANQQYEYESEECKDASNRCMAGPALAIKEDVVDNEGAGLRGSNSKTIVADV